MTNYLSISNSGAGQIWFITKCYTSTGENRSCMKTLINEASLKKFLWPKWHKNFSGKCTHAVNYAHHPQMTTVSWYLKEAFYGLVFAFLSLLIIQWCCSQLKRHEVTCLCTFIINILIIPFSLFYRPLSIFFTIFCALYFCTSFSLLFPDICLLVCHALSFLSFTVSFFLSCLP